MSDTEALSSASHRAFHHKRIRVMGRSMWPMIGVFYITGFLWTGVKVLLCSGAVESRLVCDAGVSLPALVAFVILAGLLVVVHALWSLGRDGEEHGVAPEDRSRPSRLTRAPRRIRHGLHTLEPSHQAHVHDSTRATLHALGGVVAFVAFFYQWGDVESGAWLILLGFMLAAEALVAYMRPGTKAVTDIDVH